MPGSAHPNQDTSSLATSMQPRVPYPHPCMYRTTGGACEPEQVGRPGCCPSPCYYSFARERMISDSSDSHKHSPERERERALRMSFPPLSSLGNELPAALRGLLHHEHFSPHHFPQRCRRRGRFLFGLFRCARQVTSPSCHLPCAFLQGRYLQSPGGWIRPRSTHTMASTS